MPLFGDEREGEEESEDGEIWKRESNKEEEEASRANERNFGGKMITGPLSKLCSDRDDDVEEYESIP